MPADACRLLDLRHQSIVKLAPRAMAVAQAERWASKMTIDGMRKKIQETEMWLAEANHIIVGWVAFHGDYLDGLYTDPQFVRRGVGTELLVLAEQLMQENGVKIIRADSSWNAEEFYFHRGYEPVGPRPIGGPRPLTKELPFRNSH